MTDCSPGLCTPRIVHWACVLDGLFTRPMYSPDCSLGFVLDGLFTGLMYLTGCSPGLCTWLIVHWACVLDGLFTGLVYLTDCSPFTCNHTDCMFMCVINYIYIYAHMNSLVLTTMYIYDICG